MPLLGRLIVVYFYVDIVAHVQILFITQFDRIATVALVVAIAVVGVFTGTLIRPFGFSRMVTTLDRTIEVHVERHLIRRYFVAKCEIRTESDWQIFGKTKIPLKKVKNK
jgi:hypothetical protein